MPPLPQVPDTLKAVVFWSDQEDTTVSTSHFFGYSGAGPDASEATSLASTLATAYASQDTLWGTNTILTGVKITDLATDTGGEGQTTVNVPGTETGVTLAGGTCVVVNWLIGRRYRGGKPRNYLPWGTGNQLASRQAWQQGYVTDVAAGMGGIMAAFVGTTAGGCTISNHVNVSYYESFTNVEGPTGRMRAKAKLRVNGPLVNPIVNVSVSITPGSQRRRNRA